MDPWWSIDLRALQRALEEIQSRSHPGVAAIRDVARIDEQLWWVQDLAPGEALRVTLSRACHTRAPFPLGESARRVDALADALAHLRGVAPGGAHLDLLDARECAGRMVLSEAWRACVHPSPRDHDARAPVMTVRHAAPELICGRACDERSDVFTLGAVLYELVFAEHAFAGEGFAAEAIAVVKGPDPARLRASGSPSDEAIPLLSRALRREPADRFATLAELRQALAPLIAPDVRERDAAYRDDPRRPLARAAAAQDLHRLASLLVVAPESLDVSFGAWVWRAVAMPLAESLRTGACEEAEVVLFSALRHVARRDLVTLRAEPRLPQGSVELLDALLAP